MAYLYDSAMVDMGCGMEEYIALKPELMLSRDAGAGGLAEEPTTSPLPPRL